MKCDDALKYIYLNTEIALEGKDKTDFEEHIKSCGRCQNDFASAGNYFNLVTSLHNNMLSTEEKETITGNVLAEIQNHNRKPDPIHQVNLFDIIYFPSFRFAAAIILLLIGGFYFSEELVSFQKISKLENRYGLASDKKFSEIKHAAVYPLDDIYNMAMGEKNSFKLPGDWILIRESEIIKKIRDYGNSSDAHISGINYEQELKRFFSNPKIRELMEKNEEVKNLFNRVFPEGVDNHE
jgi:hypothetical protein